MSKSSGDNTIARIIIYPIKGGFRAVCLDFDLMEEAKTRAEVQREIQDAVVGYVENIQKNGLSDELLNRYAPVKYWDMYDRYLKLLRSKNQHRINVSRTLRNTSSIAMPLSDFLNDEVRKEVVS